MLSAHRAHFQILKVFLGNPFGVGWGDSRGLGSGERRQAGSTKLLLFVSVEEQKLAGRKHLDHYSATSL
jgi:hypothetical protein